MTSRKDIKRKKINNDIFHTKIPILQIISDDGLSVIRTKNGEDYSVYYISFDDDINTKYKISRNVFINKVSKSSNCAWVRKELFDSLKDIWEDCMNYIHILLLINRLVNEEEKISKDIGNTIKEFAFPVYKTLRFNYKHESLDDGRSINLRYIPAKGIYKRDPFLHIPK